MKRKRITFTDFRRHEDLSDGYCTHCLEWTRDGDTEPDAEGYECPDCGNDACIGTHWAIMADWVFIDDTAQEVLP